MIVNTKEILLRNGKKIIFRSPDIGEAEKLLLAFRAFSETSPYILTTPESAQKMTVEDEIKFIKSHNESSSAFVMIAEYGTEIVGISSFAAYKDSKRKHRGALGITLHPDFRGQGLGTMKMKSIIENAKKITGLLSIELSVMSPNSTAHNIYKKLGFQQVGHHPKAFLLSDGHFADDILMQLWIGPNN